MAQTVKYISVAGAGAKDGSSAANAWDNTQWATAIAALDGNTKLLIAAGTYNQTGTLAFNGTAGDATQRNSIVGTNSSFVEDGSKPVFDGGSGSYNGFTVTMQYTDFDNIKITNYAGYCLSQTGTHLKWTNADFTNSTNGIYAWSYIHTFIRCTSTGHTGEGGRHRGGDFIGCSFSNNGTDGIGFARRGVYFLCIFHNNAAYGCNSAAYPSRYLQCIFDGNITGLNVDGSENYAVMFNKFTHNTTGLLCNDALVWLAVEDYNSFYDNTTDVNYNGTFSERMGENNITLTSDEYEDLANDNFNTTSDADGVNIEFDLDGTNKAYMSTQFPPAYSSAGGRQPRLRIHGA